MKEKARGARQRRKQGMKPRRVGTDKANKQWYSKMYDVYGKKANWPDAN